MTSDKLSRLADRLAGRALRRESIGPDELATIAAILCDCAELTASMEACVLAPRVAHDIAALTGHYEDESDGE